MVQIISKNRVYDSHSEIIAYKIEFNSAYITPNRKNGVDNLIREMAEIPPNFIRVEINNITKDSFQYAFVWYIKPNIVEWSNSISQQFDSYCVQYYFWNFNFPINNRVKTWELK